MPKPDKLFGSCHFIGKWERNWNIFNTRGSKKALLQPTIFLKPFNCHISTSTNSTKVFVVIDALLFQSKPRKNKLCAAWQLITSNLITFRSPIHGREAQITIFCHERCLKSRVTFNSWTIQWMNECVLLSGRRARYVQRAPCQCYWVSEWSDEFREVDEMWLKRGLWIVTSSE